MNRLLLAVLAALVAAIGVASRLGGPLGGGVLLGYLLGASLAGLSTLYVRHMAHTHPERALAAAVLGFLFKLCALVLGGLAFRYLEPLAARADYRSFLVSFAGAVALILPLGTWLVLKDRVLTNATRGG